MTTAKTLHKMLVVQAVFQIRFDHSDLASSADSRMDFSVGMTYTTKFSVCLMNGAMMPSLMPDSSAELTPLCDGLGVHLCAEIFHSQFNGRNGFIAFFLCCAAKRIRLFRMVR